MPDPIDGELAAPNAPPEALSKMPKGNPFW
jgi:hypothetical protein